jgi:hypothetical protein
MSQPWAADWEQIVGCDLVPHLIPAGQSQQARRPIGVAFLPDGARAALSDGVGHVGPGGSRPLRGRAWRGTYSVRVIPWPSRLRPGRDCARLRSADTDVDVGLWSGKATDAASSWLRQVVLGDRDCSGAGSWQGQPGGT